MITVPSLEGQTYLTDPQSIIAYILRRYGRTPHNTITVLPEMIISLSHQRARFGKDPDALCRNIQSDLQDVYNRIFRNERKITVSCTHKPNTANTYDVQLTVIYTLLNGELEQTGGTITLNKETGELVIPEDRIDWARSPYKEK